MDTLFNTATTLSDQINDSKFKSDYFCAKEELSKNVNLLLRVKDFKRKQVDFEMSLLNGEVRTFEDERIISKLYSDLILFDEAKKFLECEKALISVLLNVQNIVFDSLDIDFEI